MSHTTSPVRTDHALTTQALALCQAIEQLPASEMATDLAIKASALHAAIGELLMEDLVPRHMLSTYARLMIETHHDPGAFVPLAGEDEPIGVWRDRALALVLATRELRRYRVVMEGPDGHTAELVMSNKVNMEHAIAFGHRWCKEMHGSKSHRVKSIEEIPMPEPSIPTTHG